MKSLVLIGLISATSGRNHWDRFQTTWSEDPSMGFHEQPRDEREAKARNYRKLDSCGDSDKFVGNRYISGDRPLDIVLIYDVTGYIAGTQSVVPKSATMNEKYYNFSMNAMYNRDVIDGEEVYLTTAYFVDPSIVCTTGRTRQEFENQGTGYKLIFQNGPTPVPKNLMEIPLFANGTSRTLWHRHKCYLTMGTHYFLHINHIPYPDLQCSILFPVQLLYGYQGDEPLSGFVWNHVAVVSGGGWENPSVAALKSVADSPPCLLTLAASMGVNTMHFYFMDTDGTCAAPSPRFTEPHNVAAIARARSEEEQTAGGAQPSGSLAPLELSALSAILATVGGRLQRI